MCWGLNTLATDAHMKIAHNPLDLVLEARVSELQSVDCALQTFKTEDIWTSVTMSLGTAHQSMQP